MSRKRGECKIFDTRKSYTDPIYLFHKLYQDFVGSGTRKISGSRKQHFKLDDVVDLCENAFGYEATLIVNGVSDILGRTEIAELANTLSLFSTLQKRLRYGLPDRVSIQLFEVGFADRVIALGLREAITVPDISRRDLLIALRESKDLMSRVLAPYPSYFQHVYNNI